MKVLPTISAAVQQILSPRLSLLFTDTYTRSDDPARADPFGLNTQRQTFSSNSFSAAVNYLIDLVAIQAYYRNSIFSIEGANGTQTVSNILGASASAPFGLYYTGRVGYEFSWSDTSGTSSGSNSGQSTGNLLTASVSRQTGQYSSVGISTSYSQQSAPQSDSDSKIWNVSLFTTYGLPSGLSVSGSIGYSLLIPSDGSTTSGVSSNTNISYSFNRAVVFLGIFSDFRQTGLEGQNFGIVQTQGVTGGFLYTFTPFITGSVQASYTTNSFPGVGNSSSTPDLNTFSSTASLNWQLLRWLSMSAQYNYLLRSTSGGTNGGSVLGSGDVTVNTATISLAATF